MNPLTQTRNINKLNDKEAAFGIPTDASWHKQYKDSAWIFVGNLSFELTEGDVIAVFSQYGEIVQMNLVRDKGTGKSRGFGFICFEDQRSTILSVDNLNGIKLVQRTIRVDHVANYKPPKDDPNLDEITKMLRTQGCAPGMAEKLAAVVPESSGNPNEIELIPRAPVSATKVKKEKKHKKKEKKKKSKKRSKSESSSSSSSPDVTVKPEKNRSRSREIKPRDAPEQKKAKSRSRSREKDRRARSPVVPKRTRSRSRERPARRSKSRERNSGRRDERRDRRSGSRGNDRSRQRRSRSRDRRHR